MTGIGFSDQDIYVEHLERATRYLNTWFHQPPYRDLMDLSSFQGATYDFAVCSEVLEHVSRPPEQALECLYAILNAGGIAFITTPARAGKTVEHFPQLTNFDVVRKHDAWVLRGVQPTGESFETTDLIFHGGPGETVEMRLWGRDSLKSALLKAGFIEVIEERIEFGDIGVLWRGSPESMTVPGGTAGGLHSGVWIARKPGLTKTP